MATAATDRVSNPLGTPDATRLDLREMSGFEEEYVARHRNDRNTARLCNEILAMCLVAPGEDPGERNRQLVHNLLVTERDRELVRLRNISLGPTINARVDCPSCSERNEVDFSLDALPLDFSVGPRTIEVSVASSDQVVVRLPTAKDQEALLDASPETDAEIQSWLLARCIERYGDRTAPFDETFSRGLTSRVRHELDAALTAASPDLDLEMHVQCAECSSSFNAPFDIPSFFFSK